MVWVRPGVLLVFATLPATSELMRLDLPTLERPTKAISGALGGGNCPGSAADVTKRVRTFMPYYRRSKRKVQVKPPRRSTASAESLSVHTTKLTDARSELAPEWEATQECSASPHPPPRAEAVPER